MKRNTGTTIPLAKIYMSKREIREYLDVSDDWIDSQMMGNVPFSMVGNKCFFKVQDVNRFIERNRVF